MANTYTQIHIHAVIATRFREAMISEKWESRLFDYLTAIIQNHSHKVLAINGMPDHVHILFGLRPNQSLSDLMQKVKSSSSKWINEENLTFKKFAWQEGYGAFSYTKSDIPKVIRYIQNQKEHHQKTPFLLEYRKMLQDLQIDFNSDYLFKDPE